MKFRKVKHTQAVGGIDLKHKDGKPVKIGDVYECTNSMAATLVSLGWGYVTNDKGENLTELRDKKIQELEDVRAGYAKKEREEINALAKQFIEEIVAEEGKE